MMTEADLVKMRTALEKETLLEACYEMEKVLLELGYYLTVSPDLGRKAS